MKKIAIALAAVAAMTGSASAADLAARPYTKAPAPVAAVASWTGCYVGGGGGWGMFHQENTSYDTTVNPRVRLGETYTNSGKGWFGTVQGGCDYQFAVGSWNLVVGAFGDYDFADIHGNRLDVGSNRLQIPMGVGNEKLTDSWSVGGRIGALVTPQLLAYFSGGYSEAKFSSTTYTNFNAPFGIPTGVYSPASTYKGWFLGAGDEYALSFMPGLFWKTEARTYHYDRQFRDTFFNNTNIVTGRGYDSEKWVYSVRSELVYRFNWGGPVVAKY